MNNTFLVFSSFLERVAPIKPAHVDLYALPCLQDGETSRGRLDDDQLIGLRLIMGCRQLIFDKKAELLDHYRAPENIPHYRRAELIVLAQRLQPLCGSLLTIYTEALRLAYGIEERGVVIRREGQVVGHEYSLQNSLPNLGISDINCMFKHLAFTN